MFGSCVLAAGRAASTLIRFRRLRGQKVHTNGDCNPTLTRQNNGVGA
jgi:hypothetical protein